MTDLDMTLLTKGLDLELVEAKLAEVEQVECPVTHHFAEGVYTREMFIPKGSVILGKRHRYETCNILLKGKLQLYVGAGQPDMLIEAPLIFNSKPGVRKLAISLEDTIFLNVHPTEETDLAKIEDEFIISTEEYLKMKEIPLCHGAQ